MEKPDQIDKACVLMAWQALIARQRDEIRLVMQTHEAERETLYRANKAAFDTLTDADHFGLKNGRLGR